MSSLIVDIAKIIKIEKHLNADKLRIATVKGWQCIIGLNDFQENDLVIFIPPDSILPDRLIEEYKLEYIKKGSRIRTIKLRGVISQGLCLPIPSNKNWKEGQNVAQELGITKYEPPEPTYQQRDKETIYSTYMKYKEGKISFRRFVYKSIGLIKDCFTHKKNSNPLFSKYTDIENIKNFNTIFKEGDEVLVSEKIHGTNSRFSYLKRPSKYFWQRWILKIFGEYQFIYGSHNVQLSIGGRKTWYGEDVYGKIAKRYKLGEIIPKDYIIYGEIYGKKIQNLEYGLKDIDIVFFDLKYKDKYVDYKDFYNFCSVHKLPMAPILFQGKLSMDFLKYWTVGNSILANEKGVSQIREGCVIKTLKEDWHPTLGRKILKSINPEYLLSKETTDYH